MQPNENCPQTIGVSISGGLSSSTLKTFYLLAHFFLLEPNFGYFQYWLVKIYDIDDNNSPPAFLMIGRIGCSVLEGLIEKNVSHSKMVIHITDISSLEGAKMKYKFNKYPKGC